MRHADHPCGICGAVPASFGFRRPGHLSRLPQGQRGTLWACTDHRAEAEARRAAATADPITKATRNAAGQGDLFSSA